MIPPQELDALAEKARQLTEDGFLRAESRDDLLQAIEEKRSQGVEILAKTSASDIATELESWRKYEGKTKPIDDEIRKLEDQLRQERRHG